MANTLSLWNTINWAKPFLKNQPLDVSNMEPALTSGNIILQTMMSAPLKWRWNRGTFSFPTIPASGGTPAAFDYLLSLPDFGYLEDQWLTDATGKTHSLFGAFSLQRPTGDPSRPTHICAQGDDGQGNVSFRTKQIPNAIYTVSGDYQKKPPILVSLATPFAPVPDEFAFVFNWGFLTIMSMLVDDSRFLIWEKWFIGRLLALQDGLDEVDKNLFLGLWASNTKMAMRTQGKTQQGIGGQGS
jgi:hypothetical protein